MQQITTQVEGTDRRYTCHGDIVAQCFPQQAQYFLIPILYSFNIKYGQIVPRKTKNYKYLYDLLVLK